MIFMKAEPTVGPAIESGNVRDHMRDMRKYRRHVAIWGGISLPSTTISQLDLLTCKHVATVALPQNALLSGIRSIDLFPQSTRVLKRLESDGLRADWIRVGCDMRHALDLWSTSEPEYEHDREVA